MLFTSNVLFSCGYIITVVCDYVFCTNRISYLLISNDKPIITHCLCLCPSEAESVCLGEFTQWIMWHCLLPVPECSAKQNCVWAQCVGVCVFLNVCEEGGSNKQNVLCEPGTLPLLTVSNPVSHAGWERHQHFDPNNGGYLCVCGSLWCDISFWLNILS